MQTSQNSKSFYLDTIEALTMLGFEPIEMNFYRRTDKIPDESKVINIYCELSPDTITVTLYENEKFLNETYCDSTIEFIDTVERILNTYGLEAVELVEIESSELIKGKPIFAKSNFSTKDFIKKLIRVKSSNLWSYAFQPKDYNKGDMLIQFKGANGGPDDIYIYYDIPTKIWQKFVAAPSKGHFFWQYIRNVAKYAKLTGDKRTHLPNGI